MCQAAAYSTTYKCYIMEFESNGGKNKKLQLNR